MLVCHPCSAVWQQLVPGSSTHSSGRGRPAKQQMQMVREQYSSDYNHLLLEYRPTRCNGKSVLTGTCKHPKHALNKSLKTYNTPGTHHYCKACIGKGSQLEQQAYEIVAQVPEIQLFAMEVCALSKLPVVHTSTGDVLVPRTKKFDIVTLSPPNLIIEIMGRQHDDKPMTYSNCHDSKGRNSAMVDATYASAARAAGFTMLWLLEGNAHDRSARWTSAVQQAVSHVIAGEAPAHFAA